MAPVLIGHTAAYRWLWALMQGNELYADDSGKHVQAAVERTAWCLSAGSGTTMNYHTSYSLHAHEQRHGIEAHVADALFLLLYTSQ